MKQIIYCLSAVLLIAVGSCSKDESAATPVVVLVSTPEADAAEDLKSGGVYKGALIGSSGIIKITLQKGIREIEVTLDGVKKTLTTTSLGSWTSGQEIDSAVFTSGDWNVAFSIDALGQAGSIAFSIPGHPNIIPVITKERSTSLVKAYEGTYAGTSSGTFNFIELNNVIFGITRSATDANASSDFSGVRSGNNMTITVGGSIDAVGTFDGNNVTGTWVESTTAQGTWKGKRTM